MKILCRFSVIAVVLLAIASIPSTLHAQSTTGTIFGSVLDVSGAAIPGAKVTLTEVHTNVAQTATTDGKGDYTYAIVNPGDYTVTATANGFKTVTQTNITLAANQNIRVPFNLAVGAVTETVSVAAGVTLVDTREAQIGDTIDQNKLEDLPTLNRDAYSLVTTLPGVTNYNAVSNIGTRTGANFSVNGLSKDQVSYYLDGSYDNAVGNNGGNKIPNPGALSETRVLTSNFDAEFGRTPAAVINVITRSGTDRFHGAAYDYLENNILNARNYFVAPTSPTNPAVQLDQNQFGARIGGPVKLLPQTFFFLDYQGTVLRTEDFIAAGKVQSPSATERMGSFAGDTFGTTGTFKVPKLPAGTNCGTTAAPVICKSALDPVAQAVLAFVPVGAPGTHLIGQQVAQADSFSNEGVARFDFNHIKNHAIEAMLYYTKGHDTNPTAGGNQAIGYGGATDTEQQFNIVLADIWTLSDRTVNSFRAFISRNHYTIFNEYNQTFQSLGSQAQEGGSVYPAPQFKLNSYVTIGGSAVGPANVDQPSYGGIDTINLTRGTHSIKLGGSYVYNRYFNVSAGKSGGLFAFTGSVTGNTFADFLLGYANSFNQSNIVTLNNYNYDPALYAQDDWQITRTLNLNLGLRWEVFAPYLGGGHSFGTFAPGVQSTVVPSAPVGILYAGDKNIPPSLFNISYRDFAPRVGFAYDAFGDGRTSVRGGFGLFYFESDAINTNEQVQAPFGLTVTTNQTPNLVCPFGGPVPQCPAGTTAGTDPFPYNPATPSFQNPASGSEVFAIPANGGATPYVYEYNLTVEQQLSPTFALHIAYVGDAVRKQYIVANKTAIDENAPVYVPGAAINTAGLLARRPYEPYTRSTTGTGFRFGAINLNSNSLNGNYNSLQTTLRGRFGKKFSMFASYVWSKSLNYDGPIVNNYDLGMNYGPGANDLRHRFVVSYLYELPTTRHFGLFGREVLNGWHVNGITSFQSGNPFTVTSGTDTNLDGYTNDLVNVVGNPNLGHLSRAQRIHQGTLNPAALSVPTGPYGNEQKNQFYGPADINTDLSLYKEFPLVEQARLQFRAEAFNAFNNVNLNNPNAALTNIQNTSPTYNQITGSAPARTLQFAAKLTF